MNSKIQKKFSYRQDSAAIRRKFAESAPLTPKFVDKPRKRTPASRPSRDPSEYGVPCRSLAHLAWKNRHCRPACMLAQQSLPRNFRRSGKDARPTCSQSIAFGPTAGASTFARKKMPAQRRLERFFNFRVDFPCFSSSHATAFATGQGYRTASFRCRSGPIADRIRRTCNEF